jgi:hypothetical protein
MWNCLVKRLAIIVANDASPRSKLATWRCASAHQPKPRVRWPSRLGEQRLASKRPSELPEDNLG